MGVNKHKYSELFDAVPVGFLTLNSQGFIGEVNLFLARILRADRSAMTGRSFLPFVAEEKRDGFLSWLTLAEPGTSPVPVDLDLVAVDGTRLTTQVEMKQLLSGEYRLIIQDMTYRRQAEERMQNLTQKLRDLSAHIEAGMEKEKKRIAREIHDGLGSSLSALKMELSILRRQLVPLDPDPEIEKHINAMSVLVESTVELIRKLATELRPEVLDELGLVATLRWYAKQFEARTGILTTYTVYPKDFKIDAAISTAVFRVFQEIMNNVARHSKATRVTIFLRKQHHQFLMRVRDNGSGIREEELNHKRSFGIIGMQERIKLQKGQMKISGVRKKGTTVVIEIPLNQNL